MFKCNSLIFSLSLSKAQRYVRLIQRSGGEASSDGADSSSYVHGLREDRCSHLQTDGPQSETEALTTVKP